MKNFSITVGKHNLHTVLNKLLVFTERAIRQQRPGRRPLSRKQKEMPNKLMSQKKLSDQVLKL